MRKSSNSHSQGLTGEALALAHLQAKGYALRQNRYHCRQGEIDLVMQQGDCLVFVEVKYRKTGKHGEGLAAISPQKMRRLLLACESYLAENHWDGSVRLDLLEITAEGIQHVENVTI